MAGALLVLDMTLIQIVQLPLPHRKVLQGPANESSFDPGVLNHTFFFLKEPKLAGYYWLLRPGFGDL